MQDLASKTVSGHPNFDTLREENHIQLIDLQGE